MMGYRALGNDCYQCEDCGRIFDLSEDIDSDEFRHGHDCEVPPSKETAPMIQAVTITVDDDTNECTANVIEFERDSDGTTLKHLQAAVAANGYNFIERYPTREDVDMYINEEGLYAGVPRNPLAEEFLALVDIHGMLAAGNVVMGNVILVAGDEEGNTISAPQWVLDWARERIAARPPTE